MIAACTSTTTVTQSHPSTAACFDSAKVKGLYDEWAHKAADANLSDDMDMAQVVASLRATREIALELALATAADPAAAGHFKDAADAYLKAPPIPPHASLPLCPAATSTGSRWLPAKGSRRCMPGSMR